MVEAEKKKNDRELFGWLTCWFWAEFQEVLKIAVVLIIFLLWFHFEFQKEFHIISRLQLNPHVFWKKKVYFLFFHFFFPCNLKWTSNKLPHSSMSESRRKIYDWNYQIESLWQRCSLIKLFSTISKLIFCSFFTFSTKKIWESRKKEKKKFCMKVWFIDS